MAAACGHRPPGLRGDPGVADRLARGVFRLYPPSVPGRVRLDVAETLACEHGVLLLPAPAFAGSPDHLRVSFANVDAAGISGWRTRLAGVPLAALAA